MIRPVLLALVIAAPLAGQAADPPHVHGGFAACHDAADWLTQERPYQTRDLALWHEIMRPRLTDGRCWLTEDGALYEVAASDVPGTVLVRSPMAVASAEQAKAAAVGWAYLSVAALEVP